MDNGNNRGEDLKGDELKALEALKNETLCLKDYKCLESGFEDVCAARDVGLDDYLLCVERDQPQCNFAFPFGAGLFCRCPIRIYIVKIPD